MILPVIDYGSVVYDSISIYQNNKLENLQRRAAIICSGAHFRTETNKLLGDLGWVHLKDRRNYLKRVYFYKIYVNASPPYLNDVLRNLVRNPKLRETRSSNTGKLYNPKCRKAKFRASFFPSSIADWNNLSVDLVRIDSLNKLKKFLNEKFVFDSRVYYYNSFHGKGSKILTQMRLGLSPLKGHLFVYNLEDNPFCQGCLSHIETTSHYLFECVKFRNERDVYLSNLAGHLPTVNLPIESWNLNEMVNLCTGGSIALDSNSNFHILNSTVCFINSTRRFIY